MVDVEQKKAIKMKGINRDIRIYSVKGRKTDSQERVKIAKVTEPTTKELTEIEKLKQKSEKLEDETNVLKEELALIKLELKKMKNV